MCNPAHLAQGAQGLPEGFEMPMLFAECLKLCCCLKEMRSWEATTLTDALCSGSSMARCLANGDSMLLCVHGSMP